ncbi:alpha/beta fold hydrolase [Aerosakkonema funiforme]
MPKLNLQRKTLNLPQIQLSYLEWGQGEPVLLLHGLADCALVWASLGEYLANSYHSVAPDIRGHGESSKPENGYRSADIIADLQALMDNLGWSDAHIIAHSWMAKVACVWAKQHPQRFRSLVIIDPFFIGKMPSFTKLTFPFFYKVLPFLKCMGPFPSYVAAENLARQLKQYKGWSPLQEAAFKAGMEEKKDGTWGSKFVVQARNQVFEDVMLVAGLTETLEVATLLLLPEQGLNRSEFQIKPFRTYLKNVSMQKIPGNHWAFLVEPDAFNQAVAKFLNSFT